MSRFAIAAYAAELSLPERQRFAYYARFAPLDAVWRRVERETRRPVLR